MLVMGQVWSTNPKPEPRLFTNVQFRASRPFSKSPARAWVKPELRHITTSYSHPSVNTVSENTDSVYKTFELVQNYFINTNLYYKYTQHIMKIFWSFLGKLSFKFFLLKSCILEHLNQIYMYSPAAEALFSLICSLDLLVPTILHNQQRFSPLDFY